MKRPKYPNNSSPLDTPVAAWLRLQRNLAEKANVTLITLKEDNDVVGRIENNNSICQAMQASENKRLCDLDCGTAFSRANEAGQTITYRCHASLHCFATPVEKSEEPLVVLGGRAFTSSADYADCLEKYQDFEPIKTGDALGDVNFTNPYEMADFAELVAATAQIHLRAQGDSTLTSDSPLDIDATPELRDAHLEIIRLSEELERRNRAIVRLQEFMRDVAVNLDSEIVYSSILEKFSEMMRTEKSSLMVLHGDSDELSLEAAVGATFDNPDKIRVRLGDGISGSVLATGTPLLVRDVDKDKRIRSPHSGQYKTKSFISYPITLGQRKFGVINLTDRVDGSPYENQDLSLLEMLAPQLALLIDRTEWYKKAEQYQQMSLTDPLTGLPNRRYLEERLSEEIARSKRHSTSLAFLLIDIDFFKKYNDIYGHTNADCVLIKTAQILRRAVRAIDMPARYAGDEFCIILPETDVQAAAHIAERICNEVRRTEYHNEQGEPMGKVTLSVGVSSFAATRQTPHSIIETADRALYRVKMRGRNGIAVYEDDA